MNRKSRLAILMAVWLAFTAVLLSRDVGARDYDYEIKFYDVDITVNEDNTFNVKETIVTYFNEQKHGIIRVIPLTNEIVRSDGSTSSNKARISDVNVEGWDFTLDNDTSSQQLRIKIGSADTLISEQQTFVITYTYDIGRDPLKDLDEFYFNIIGTMWDTVIEQVHFRLTFPKPFDPEKIGFAHGREGSLFSGDVYYNILEDNKVLEGSYFVPLMPYEALTVRLELPEGYFHREISWKYLSRYLWFLMPLGITVIYAVLFLLKGKEDPVVETVEFYPPEDMDPLDVAFSYKGKLDRNDLTSMIIFLANLGYLSIEKKDTDYEIICLKPEGDYTDEIGYISSYFYKSLYGCSYKRKADGARVVSRNRMLKNFYNKGESILDYYNKEIGKGMIITENRFLKYAGIFLGLVMLVFPLLMITYDSLDLYKIFLPFFLTMWYGIFLYAAVRVIRKGNNFIGVIMIVFAVLHFVAIFTAISYNGLLIALITDPLNIYITIISEGLALIVLIMAWNMDKRTEYGNELLGKLKGFRHFLETAEKDRLEALVEENPFYFFDILPYAYVLGVSKRWIQQFEDLVTSPPEWFSGYETFKYSYIESFVDYGLDRWQSTMNYKPAPVHTSHSYSSSSSSSYDSGYSSSDYSYSSSSSDSGGSSSGGGSGGGGGTSW